MSKKKSKKVNEGEKKNENHEQKEDNSKNVQKSEDGEKKQSNGGNAVVLKMDLHCDGCASKVVKYIRGFEGVDTVQVDGSSGKITVTGKVDPLNLREKLEEKAHKKVELLSPVPKKDKENAKEKNDAGHGKEEKKKDSKEKKPKDNNNAKNKKDEKNSKEPPVTTAVLKVALHCEGCIQKINKIVSKTKGYEEMKVDKQQDLVTVKGAMDMKDLAETLKKHLKRDVVIVPSKKDEKKEKGSGEAGGGGGEGKNAGGGGHGGEKMEGIKMQQQMPLGYGYQIPSPNVYGGMQQQQQQQIPFGYGYPSPSPYVYGEQAYGGDPYQFHPQAPQMFSDENPNACSVM